MAKNITTQFAIDLNLVVESSITAVKATRKREQIRKEAEFQRAIANGLSYEEVIKIREKQLEEENASSISDSDYIEVLKVSIAETKKLDRYQKYRTKYRDALAELVVGKINEEDFNLNLKRTLDGITDPALILEVQGYIIQSEKDVKQYKDNILHNQVNAALKDKTESVLTGIIERVNVARAQALISDKQDDITAHDEELIALNAQLSTTRIENAVLNIDVRSATTGFNSLDKLNYINTEIQKADPNTPVRIGNRSYTSAQQFWTLERDNFLAGNSQVFGNFFGDLKTLTENVINADSKIFKENTTIVLDNVKDVFDQLRTKPELTPFIDRLNAAQTSVMSNAVNTVAAKIVAISSQNFDFANGDIQLQNLNKYGTDIEAYRILLRDKNIAVTKEEGAGTTDISTELKIPKIGEQPKSEVAPTTLITPTTTPTIPTTPKPPAEKSPVAPVAPITPVSQSPQFTPQAGVGAKSDDGKFEFTKEGWKPTTPISSVAPLSTPVLAVTPTGLKSAYTGSSIIDYLKSSSLDSSAVNRAKLAVQYNVVKSEDEYLKAAQTGANATMNTQLLDILRKQQ